MHAYRFRIMSDTQDDFLRDVDVLANQTFKDLHLAFITLFDLKSDQLASFYFCDHKWRRMKELTLIDMQPNEDFDEDDEEDKAGEKDPIPVFVMDKLRIKEAIDDPHQRLVYEYDFLNPVVFYIELIKIVVADKEKTYPLCVRAEGEYKKTPSHKQDLMEDLGEDLLTDDDDMLDDTFEVDNDDATINEPPSWQ